MPKRKESSRESCTCSSCVSCCERKPGWMKPGEAERIAAFLGIPLDQLFRDHLAVDWWEADSECPETFVLSPAIKGAETGSMFPGNPSGVCVFLKRGRCGIHAVKPFECAGAWCGDGAVSAVGSLHRQARDAWNAPENQQQIRDLLGCEPETSSYSIFDFLTNL